MSILPKHSLIPHFGIPSFFFLIIFVNGQLLKFLNGQKNKSIGGPIRDYAENKDILQGYSNYLTENILGDFGILLN